MHKLFDLLLRGVLGLIWLFALTLTAILLGPIHLLFVLFEQLLQKVSVSSSRYSTF